MQCQEDHFFLTQEDHDYILDKNKRRDRIDYEQHIEIDGDSSDEE